jgi:hypothetical protein
MRKTVVTFLVSICLVSPLMAEQLGLGRLNPFRDKKVTYQEFRVADVTVQYPEKDWNQLPGAGTVLVTFAQKNGEAAVVIDRTKLPTPLAPEDITDLFMELETELVKERDPSLQGMRSTFLRLGEFPRIVQMDFTRGAPPREEQVRQISIPMGWYLYRVVASARIAEFEKYEEMFLHMMTTLSIRPSQG